MSDTQQLSEIHARLEIERLRSEIKKNRLGIWTYPVAIAIAVLGFIAAFAGFTADLYVLISGELEHARSEVTRLETQLADANRQVQDLQHADHEFRSIRVDNESLRRRLDLSLRRLAEYEHLIAQLRALDERQHLDDEDTIAYKRITDILNDRLPQFDWPMEDLRKMAFVIRWNQESVDAVVVLLHSPSIPDENRQGDVRVEGCVFQQEWTGFLSKEWIGPWHRDNGRIVMKEQTTSEEIEIDLSRRANDGGWVARRTRQDGTSELGNAALVPSLFAR